MAFKEKKYSKNGKMIYEVEGEAELETLLAHGVVGTSETNKKKNQIVLQITNLSELDIDKLQYDFEGKNVKINLHFKMEEEWIN